MDHKFYPPPTVDPDFVDKVVQEVKSQGIFDEFRRDFIADVDTKPAYQNLRAKVEATTQKFLEGIEWSPDMNKHQLRERLRKHVEESTALDIGLSRLVDQVVNPKIETVIRPKVEEISYAMLGVPAPKRQPEPPKTDIKPPLPPLPPMPPYNGKDVPLNVETASSLLPTDLEQISPDSDHATMKSDCKDETESVHNITDEKVEEDDESPPFEPLEAPIKKYIQDEQDITPKLPKTEPDSQNGCNKKQFGVGKEGTRSLDAGITQESQLSRISSDSRLTPVFTETQRKSMENAVAANLSEEAQMPKFYENSNDTNVSQHQRDSDLLHFDIKKDEIKFEGTERKSSCLLNMPQNKDGTTADVQVEAQSMPQTELPLNGATKESHNRFQSESDQASQNTRESSFGSSLDDTSSAQMNKLKIDTGTETTEPLPPSKVPAVKAGSAERSNSCRKSVEREHGKSESAARHSQSHSHSLAPSQSSSSQSSRYKKHSKHSHHRESSSHKRKHSSRDHESSSRQSSSHRSKRSKRSQSPSSVRHSSSSSRNVKKTHERDRERDRYREHHKHKESGERGRERGRERNKDDQKERKSKSKSNNDDHNLSKAKYQRRKSHDSNDGDQKRSSTHNASHQSSKSDASRVFSSSGSHSTHKSKSKSRSGSDANINSPNETGAVTFFGSDENANETHKKSFHGNVVLLNDFLDNPKTDFIEFNNENYVQIVQAVAAKPAVESVVESGAYSYCNDDDSGLMCENEILGLPPKPKAYYAERKEIYDETINLFHEIRNMFEQQVEEVVNEKEDEVNTDKEVEATNVELNKPTVSSSHEVVLKAQVLLSCAETKASPTPSDSSVNSKENEIFDKNAVAAKKSLSQRKISVANKFNTQRYTSEDLYKPRPVLSQRSRRRELH